jgi:hypothetical protein
MLRWTDGGHFWTAQRRSPHPPLRALRLRQPCREHREGPRTPRCRRACRQKAPRCRAGRATCAGLPMPALWRLHDRHRGVRPRLRAKVAANAEQGRHVMSQTPCDRSHFLVPMRWPNTGGDLSRPNHSNHRAVRPLIPSEPLSKCPRHSPDLPCALTCRGRHAHVPPTIDLGAHIKSP